LPQINPSKLPEMNRYLFSSLSILIVIVGFFCSSHSLFAQRYSALPDDMGKRIDETFLAWDTAWTPGVAVAVVKNGQIAFKNGYGFAHLEYDIPITPKTIFHIASISKQFTTFSILLLEADGKLSLDDDIRKHIPEVPDFGTTITLRHLAHNISGIRDQWNLLAMAGWRLDDIITTEQVLRLLARQKELNFQPGEEYLYSNSGFTLLAEVVARVSGKSFAEFTRERIFEPLGMQHTLFYDDHEKIVRNRAYSYAVRNGEYRKRVLSYATAGATSLFTTVEDLSLWALNFDNPRVGSASIIEKMNTQGVLNDGTIINYALGQVVGTYRGIPMISHGGADAGYRTFLTRFPEHDVSVIVFSNDGGFNSGVMAMKVADIVLEDLLEKEKEEEPWDAAIASADPRLFPFYEGHFKQAPDNHIIFLSKQDTLFFRTSSNRQPIKLYPLSAREFITEGGTIRFVFPELENGPTETVELVRNDETTELPRAEIFDPALVNLYELTGRYYSDELDITYTIEVKEGEDEDPKLIITHLRIGEITLTPLTPGHFAGSIWFASRIRFEKDNQGVITGFRASGGRVRDVWFERVK
jgi:CubicO group peptidase (beta-lactamase class C family)